MHNTTLNLGQGDKKVTITRFSELHLWALAEFIRSLKEGSTTPDKWYSCAAILAKLIPELTQGNEPYVELNRFDTTGDIYLTVDQLQEIYTTLFDLWKQSAGEITTLSEPDELVSKSEVDALKRELDALRAQN